MKRFFISASWCALLWVALSSIAFAQTLSGPSMVLPERSFDFKEVDEGNILEHAFRVLNKGNEVLVISRVNPG